MCDDIIGLRATSDRDIPFVVETEQDPSNALYIRNWDYQTHQRSLVNGDIQHLIVESITDQASIGFVIIGGLKVGGSRIELKRIAVTKKGRGIGRRVIRLIKKHVFENLEKQRLWLEVVAENRIAKMLYKSEGFVSDGWQFEPNQEPRFQNLELMSIDLAGYQKLEVA